MLAIRVRASSREEAAQIFADMIRNVFGKDDRLSVVVSDDEDSVELEAMI